MVLESLVSNPKTLGLNPWRGGVNNFFFFCPSKTTLVQTCVRLHPPPLFHLFVCTVSAHICAHVKDHIYRKGVGLTAVGLENAHRRKKNLVAPPYYGCSLSPGKAARISCALHWDKKVTAIIPANRWPFWKEMMEQQYLIRSKF